MTDLFAKIMALAEEGGLSASPVGEMYGVPKSTARTWLEKYQRVGQVGRRSGSGFWRVFSPSQDAALVAEVGRHPFISARDLKAATGFPGQKTTLISRLRNQVSGHDTLQRRSFSLTNINYTV
jgi:UDP-N-acetyl-D-mannosaminuronic acid transferase (WecB/TagA/CpsF family)